MLRESEKHELEVEILKAKANTNQWAVEIKLLNQDG